MSASTHWLATATAQAVLERGGNAFDAAAAGAFVLQVVEPHLNGPGGDVVGLFVTSFDPRRATVLMGQGPAPAGATVEHYRSEGLTAVPGSGALAAAVPGAVEAWLRLLRDHGSWELEPVLEFAIGYARDGHPISPRAAATISASADLFSEHWTSSAETWLPEGEIPVAGALVRNPALARTLQRLLDAAIGESREERIDAARREWREGFVAEAIAEFVATPHRHSTGTDHAGVMTAEDIAGFEAGYEPAVTMDFRGRTIAKAGMWSQGPTLLQSLAILDGFDDALLDPSTGPGAHTVLEVMKLALADREVFYGDDAAVPAVRLLSPEYAASRRMLVTDFASEEFRPGVIEGVRNWTPPLVIDPGAITAALAGEPTVGSFSDPTEPRLAADGAAKGDTCHIDVIDRWGNVVSATPSGGWLQSNPTIPELGFCLGTRLQMTWLEDGSPSRLEPGKRPRTTLSPTIVIGPDDSVTALGTPGGDQQDQWQLLYLLRTIVGGWSPQEAIDAPAFHTTSFPESFWPRTWTPGGVVAENRLGGVVLAELVLRGHSLTQAGDWTLGRLSAVGRDADGYLFAAANPRGLLGYAAGR